MTIWNLRSCTGQIWNIINQKLQNAHTVSLQLDYFGKTDQDSQIYDNNTYIKNCTYIGNVQEVTEDGLVAFEQKNKFSVGEEIECMNFDGTNTVCRVEEIYNDRMESAPHPKMQLYVKLDRPVSAGMILRRQELSE